MTTIDQAAAQRRPQYRHATEVPVPVAEQLLNPFSWRVGHWAFFLGVMTMIADLIVALYVFNFFGLSRQFEISMWLLVAGLLGFTAITLALYAVVFNAGRGIGIAAFLLSFFFGAAPAWLVGNTIWQLIINGGQLPYAPIDW